MQPNEPLPGGVRPGSSAVGPTSSSPDEPAPGPAPDAVPAAPTPGPAPDATPAAPAAGPPPASADTRDPRRASILQAVLIACVAVAAGTTLFVAGFTIGRQTALTPSTPAQLQAQFEPFWNAYHTIEDRFALGPIPADTLVQGALKGMFEALRDPYSYYMTADAYKQSLAGLSGQFVGIGVELETVAPDGSTGCSSIGAKCALTIQSVIPDSPADRAGVLAGETIIEVDGVATKGKTLSDVANVIRGPRGTPVTLRLQRGTAPSYTVTIVRQVVTTPDVSTRVLDGGRVGYIRIDAFGSNVASEFRSQLAGLVDRRGLTRIVLDLRNDPGGFVDQARAIASQFIASGPIFYEETASGAITAEPAEPGGVATSPSIRVAVLVNGNTASASEIVSGALQATGRGMLVGEQTFGKGTIQEWQLLSNDAGGFRLTIAKWLTPDKQWVNHVGLTPNVVVKVPSTIPAGQDPILDRAITLLTGTSGA